MRRFPRARARHLRNRSAAAAAGSAAGAEEKKRKTPIEPAVTPTPIGAWQSIGRRRPERTAAGSRRGTSADTAHPLRPRTCLRVCACVCVCVCVCVFTARWPNKRLCVRFGSPYQLSWRQNICCGTASGDHGHNAVPFRSGGDAFPPFYLIDLYVIMSKRCDCEK